MPFARDQRHILSTLVGVLMVGLIVLLPEIAPGVRGQGEIVQAYRGEIVSIQQPTPDADPDTPPVPIAKVKVLEGPLAGQTIDAFLSGPGGSQIVALYRPGESVVVTVSDNQDGSPPFVSVSDRWRILPLEILVLLFAAVVIVVGGWHGVRALVALGLTIAVILKILIPLLIWGAPPVPLAVLAASGVTVVTILLTEGWNRSSMAAILGTTGAIAITGLLAAAATAAMGFTYTTGSDLAFLTTANGQGLDLRGVLLAAFILGAVGVLDDVTVTQAVLVNELSNKAQLRGSRLFTSAMAIGRSHIAATVNTLFLAYVGAGLPLLVLLVVSRQPGAIVFNDELIATEITRTVVGGLGIVAAVPLTTFIATSLVHEAATGAGGPPQSPVRRVRTALAAGGIIGVLLVMTAALPLTAGPRSALAPDIFATSGGPSAVTPSSGPSTSPTEPRLFEANEPVPITLDAVLVGTITVVHWTVKPGAPPATEASISVDVRYVATAPFALDAGSWELLLADGTEVPLSPAGPDSLVGTLAAGEARDVRLTGTFTAADEGPFIVYVDRATGDFAFLVSVD